MQAYTSHTGINIIFLILIIFWGIGFLVLVELYEYPKRKRLSLHSKLVIVMTIVLLVSGTTGILFLENQNPNTIQHYPLRGKLLSPIFQSATARTAGFNTIPIDVKHVITKANSALHGKVLEKVGSDRVVYPGRDERIRIARSLIMPNIKNHMKLSQRYSLIEIAALPIFCEKTLAELDLPGKYGVTLLAIRRGNQYTFSPTAKHTIGENENLILVGENKRIDQLISKYKASKEDK